MRYLIGTTLICCCAFAQNFTELSPQSKRSFQSIVSVKPSSDRTKLINRLQALRQQQRLEHNVIGYAICGELLTSLDRYPKVVSDSQLCAWFESCLFKGHSDIYILYPGVDVKTMQKICAVFGYERMPLPTQIDVKYNEVVRYLKSVTPNTADEEVALRLREALICQGSRGNFKSVQRTARQMILSENTGYKGASEQTLKMMSQIAEIEGYYALQNTKKDLLQWQNRLDVNPHGELYAVSRRLMAEVDMILLYGGDIQDFLSWGSDTFSKYQSVYFQYPAIESHRLQELFIAAGIPADAPTPVDEVYRSVHSILKTQTPGSDDALFWADVFEQVEAIGSYGNIEDLQIWYDVKFVISNKSPFFIYSGLSQGAMTKFADFANLDSIPTPTEIDKKFADTHKWVQSLPKDSSEYYLANELLFKMETVGSYGSLDEIQEWAQSIVDDEAPLPVAPPSQDAMPTVDPAQPSQAPAPQIVYKPSCAVGQNTRLTARHREGDGVGYAKGYSTLAAFLTPNWDRKFQPFIDVRGHIFNNSRWATNIGLGGRYEIAPGWALGANFYHDWRNTKKLNLQPHQLGAGLELLSSYFDVRVNGYVPVGIKAKEVHAAFNSFQENFLICRGEATAALSSVYGEVGAYIPWWFEYIDLYAAIGPYYLFKRNVVQTSIGDEWGVKFRLSAQLYDGLKAEFDITYDDLFNTRPQGYLSYTFPLGPSNLRTKGKRWKNRTATPDCMASTKRQRRLTQDVERNEIIPIASVDTLFTAIDPRTGERLFFVFVDNTSSSLGTFESPYPTMALAEANSKPFDVIYVFPGNGTSSGYDTGFVMKDNQILQSSSQPFVLGSFVLGATTPGAARPILTNTAGDGLTLANNVNVSGFTFANASADGVNASSAGDFFFFNNIVTNNTNNGLESTGAPAGTKCISSNQFIADNVGATLNVAEIQISMGAGNNFEILNNSIDGGGQATFGFNAAITAGNSELLISGNDISGYTPSFIQGGAANITLSSADSNPVSLLLTRNTLTGPGAGFNGSYTIISSSGENNIKINDNGFSAHGFFHTFVSHTGGRTILETNNNNYPDAILVGQIVIRSAGQICHSAEGNMSPAILGLDFRNFPGPPSAYQIESINAAPSGVATSNPGITPSYVPSTASFTFVLPDTPCP